MNIEDIRKRVEEYDDGFGPHPCDCFYERHAKQDTLDLLEHIEAQDRQIIRMREALEWMVSPASDWENGEIGVGYRFRNHASAALSLLERKRK